MRKIFHFSQHLLLQSHVYFRHLPISQTKNEDFPSVTRHTSPLGGCRSTPPVLQHHPRSTRGGLATLAPPACGGLLGACAQLCGAAAPHPEGPRAWAPGASGLRPLAPPCPGCLGRNPAQTSAVLRAHVRPSRPPGPRPPTAAGPPAARASPAASRHRSPR